MAIVFSQKLIRAEKTEKLPLSLMPRISLAVAILAMAITITLMAFALPVALGW